VFIPIHREVIFLIFQYAFITFKFERAEWLNVQQKGFKTFSIAYHFKHVCINVRNAVEQSRSPDIKLYKALRKVSICCLGFLIIISRHFNEQIYMI